ncbi:MAG TPA: sigma-54 dependent transcriptional regulator [Thermoanaerobaculia bacterium]|nr:sigma-54 dependent transcriptional regulator [Thermoanaerobaculia bacterium]
MPDLLIVEDQAPVAAALETLFAVERIACAVARGPREALDRLAEEDFSVVVQDMNFSPHATTGEEGAELFREIRRRHPRLPVLLITAWTSLETAVALVKEGAADYLAKPWDDDKLVAAVRDLLRRRRNELASEESLRSVEVDRAGLLAAGHDLAGVVYASRTFHRVVELALQVAPSEVPVLITGPSGVGKEKVAEIVQRSSRRRQGPFLKVNAGGLPEGLLEAELFGAEAGAYTGIARRRIGRFEAADGGTLFLDEIGNLSPAGQAGLLRVLQSGEFERLGSSQTRRVDVRVLAATNIDLAAALAAGRFREDLYYRLRGVELRLPPLVARPEDVLALAEHFLAELGPSSSGERWTLSPPATGRLLAHSWPGNVRELASALERATLVAVTSELTEVDLGLGAPSLTRPKAAGDGPAPAAATSDDAALRNPERLRIERALAEADGVVARAAEALGLSRQALYRRMEKHGLRVERRLEG